MSLKQLVAFASEKTNFTDMAAYIAFCERYLEFIEGGLQAVIVSRNEPRYQFYQYRDEAHFRVTRPINSELMYDANGFDRIAARFPKVLAKARSIATDDVANRSLIGRTIYTVQQSIGAALDALPVGESNKARKVNGDLFERLIQILVKRLGVKCETGRVTIPILVEGAELAPMTFYPDLVLKASDGQVRAIGGVKTSSKDRLDKIFVDKFLYCRLTETCIPHFAVFLNDVQRKGKENHLGVNGTFKSGHFKGFTIKLNPLDGVYYCDLRPNMTSDPFLKQHIKSIDHFFCTDLWRLRDESPGDSSAVVEPDPFDG